MQVIHYGSKVYNPSKVLPIENSYYWVKPKGGLWTSPVDSKWGWKDWCANEDFRECNDNNSFILEIKEDAKLLIINTLKDLRKIAHLKADYGTKVYPDFYMLSKQYDAIWLTELGQQRTRSSFPTDLYGWDCETVFIMNPTCVYQIYQKQLIH